MLLAIPNSFKKKSTASSVLTETKKKGKGNKKLRDYLHFYSGVDKIPRAKRGASIVINKNTKETSRDGRNLMRKIMKLY